MNKIPPFRKKIALFVVLLTVMFCLVLPVAGGEEGAGPSETTAPPEPPMNITNATAPVLNISLTADPPVGPVPLTVRFTSAARGLAVDLWTWTVDGVAAAGNESNFTHTFFEPGTHTVGLTAVNESASVTNTSSVEIVAEENVTAAPAPAAAPPVVVLADPPAGTHPRDWYVSPVPGTGNPDAYANVTGLLNLTDLGDGDTVHIWGAEGHTYEGGVVIDASDVTVKRWEGSPVQPLITNISSTSAFTVTADNATFLDLNISGNRLNGKDGAGINAFGTSGNHLQRLTITNCTFAGNVAEGGRGGALSARYVDGLLVEGTTFTGNTARCGGGASLWSCDCTTLTTTFSGNTATHYGGGTWFSSCNAPTLTGTAFTGNTAGYYGGGAYFGGCDAATLTTTTFTGNTAQFGGGAHFSSCNYPTLTTTTVTNNTASSQGGGAHFMGCTNATLTNNTLTNNTASYGGGAHFSSCNYPTLTGTIVTNNTAPYYGGGAYFWDCEAPTLTGTAVTDNTATYHGGGAYFYDCGAARLTGTTVTDNTASYGGGACFNKCSAPTLTGTAVTNNTATYYGGGAYFYDCGAARLTGTAVTNNTASSRGGGAWFDECTDATLTNTTFSGNTATYHGGGAAFWESPAANITNCRFDNPTNIYAENSTATLNTTRTPGTNIAGGPYLGGNLWLNDPAQNISEWAADADYDGICDDPQITDLGTDALPLVHGGGTVQINATPADAFVFVDDANTTRTANNPFYLPLGKHTVSVQKEGFFAGEQKVTVAPGANDPLAFTLTEIKHPMNWYVSTISGNYTNISAIPDLGDGDTVHIWGVEGHTYEGGVVIDKPNVTVKRWEGSPVRPLITNRSGTSAFTVTANAHNATFRDLNISDNHLNYDSGYGAGINAVGTSGDHLQRLTITNCTFAGNAAEGSHGCGGALSARCVDDLLVEGTAFTGNAASSRGGGAWFSRCDDATLTNTTFTNNTAGQDGGGAWFSRCDDATLTNTSFIGNSAISGGGACFSSCNYPTLTTTTFTNNTADHGGGGACFSSCNYPTLTTTTFIRNSAISGGGAYFMHCEAPTLTTTTFTNNTAGVEGGGTWFWSCDAATLTGTTFTNNTATYQGGGAYFEENYDANITNCRFDNPTNIYAFMSFGAVLNTPRTRGTNIAGGPYLGGNLWLNDPEQNISERGIDADYDGICDEPLKIDGGCFGTDHLPLMHGGGTVQINATPADAFVFVDDINTTRTADNPFYLPLGEHTVSVQKDGYIPAEEKITVAPGANDPLAFTLTEIKHPMDWYVSTISGNYTTISAIPDLGEGDTVHIWGVEGHTYEGGIVIDKPNVTVKRWEGSPVQPLITNTSNTAPAFTVIADNATFRGLNISLNQLNGNGAAINATGTSRLTVADCTFTENEVNGTDAGGGALSARYVDDILIERTAFTGNNATRYGGGARFMYCNDSTITDTTFTDNAARFGGGVQFLFCNGSTLTNATLTTNTARMGGGGADFIGGGAVAITGATFTDNNGSLQGGGARFYYPDSIALTGTTFTRNSAIGGGGAYVTDSDGVTVTDTAFVGNNATRYGGGAELVGCDDAILTGTTFTRNSAQFGGGAWFDGCTDAIFTSATVTDNTATNGGGAGFDGCTNATLAASSFTDNRARYDGGAVNVTGTDGRPVQHFTIADCTFTGNTVNGTDAGGGALSARFVNDILVERTAFTGNTAEKFGGGARFMYCNDSTITDTTFTDNAARFGGGVQFLICNSPTLANATVTGNRATSGGGGADFFYSRGPVTLTGTTVTGNTAANQGGGARFYLADDSCATITDTAFTDNSARFGGGAHFQGDDGAMLPATVLTNATFVNNTAERLGGGAYFVCCDETVLTDLSFTNNTAEMFGGGAYFYQCHDATLNASAFTGNRAAVAGGAINVTGHCGTSKVPLQHFAIADCIFTGNAADQSGGALSARLVDNLSVERTAFTGNDAPVGGGTHLIWCNDTFVADCRFDNPANIRAEDSTGVLNATRKSGTNIAGGPYLGGNLWLSDPAQNISEWGADVDFDGICDQPLAIEGLGTDVLPLTNGGNRGTLLLRASAFGGYVYVDGINTTRTADHFPAPAPRAMANGLTPPADAFFLPAGNHTVEIVGPTTYGRAAVDLAAGATEPVIVEVDEVDVQGYAVPRQGPAPLDVSFETGFTGPRPDRLAWTFGDNGSSVCPYPDHTYPKAGEYTATLTAMWGETADLLTLVRTVNVTAEMPAPVLFLSAAEGNAPFTLDVAAAGEGAPERWHLDLGDGRTVEGTSPAEINRSVTYEQAGTYPLTLTVSTGAFTNATTSSVTVLPPPDASFRAKTGADGHPLAVAFTDTSTGNVTAWSWEFGDGNTSIDPDPTHRYADEGTYTVRLTVSNRYGASTAERNVTVSFPESHGGRSATSAGSAGKIAAGDTAALMIPDSAIYEVRVTAAEAIPRMLITVGRTGLPAGTTSPASAVYEYDEVTLYQTAGEAVEHIVVLFSVPKTWFEEQGIDPADVALYRSDDGAWQPLPTEVAGEDETAWHFSATSPGFFLFAIGGEPSAVSTPVMTPAAPAETVETLTTTPAAAGTTPSGTQTPFPTALVVVAMAIAAMAIRKRK